MTTLLIDYHHHDLFRSIQMLCDRLGWTVVRPIGMDWFDAGYWNFERAFHGDAVAKQYLTPWGSDETDVESGLHRRYDPSHDVWQNLVTLGEARDLRPDIVIASVAHNHEGLHRFAREVGAKFGLHLGNVRFSEQDSKEDRWDLADFGIVTSILPITPPKPHVVVHQEFSLEDFRHESPPNEEPMTVSSFVNCFPETRTYPQFVEIARMRPQYLWQVFGAYGSAPEDEFACGNVQPCRRVGEEMRASHVAWHTKIWSDGFGHICHNWFAVGRPVVGFAGYYQGDPRYNLLPQLAGPLWVEGETSFNLDGLSHDEVAGVIDRLYNDPDLRLRMGENAARRFREIVDFDHEEQLIRRMFEAVL